MSNLTREAMKFEIEMMEIEIMGLPGKLRQGAINAYHKLLISAEDEPIYIVRSWAQVFSQG